MPIYFDCHVILQQNEKYHHLQFLLDYDPVVETFFIHFNTIRTMSKVLVDYVSVSLLLCVFFWLFFVVFFFHFRIVRPKIRERILLQLFMYMREKNEIAFAHFENCFRMKLIHLM